MTTHLHLPPDPDGHQPMLDARLHLLDRQVIDEDGEPITAVDDLELSDPADPSRLPEDQAPKVTALLAGASLATRILGGRPPRSRLHAIPWHVVVDVGVSINLSIKADQLDIGWTERWVRDHIITKIPGGRHAPK